MVRVAGFQVVLLLLLAESSLEDLKRSRPNILTGDRGGEKKLKLL